MLFWFFVFLLGALGAIADIALNRWSEMYSFVRWGTAGILFLLFMTGFGMSMKLGADRELSLSAVVLIVLLANIAGVAVWDFFALGTRFTSIQWVGMALAIGAFTCFELGKS